jgi:hypothetical protein
MILKYSQLHIAKATKEQINSVSKKLGLTPEQVVSFAHEVDPTSKYEVWLLKQMGFRNIILPEDADRVKKTLKQFEQLNHRNQLKFQNINQYKNIVDLENEIETLLPKELGDAYSYDVQEFLKLPGVSVLGQNNKWFILEVSDPKSLTVLGDSTEWCTRHLQWANKYIVEDNTKQYVAFKKQNGKLVKYAQFAEDFSQFKNVKDHEIKEIPDSLFSLIESKFVEVPLSFIKRNPNAIYPWLEKQGAEIKEDLNLLGTAITKLPESLTTVGGDLDLYGTAITKLPEGLTTIGGYLDLRGTKITKLPEGLTTVGGNLNLRGTKITKLPEGLTTVGGSLFLEGTAITKLPEGLTTIGGTLNLYGTAITKLPEGLTTIGGYLDLSGTSITKLPEGLTTVGGSLFLEGTAITKLPESLTTVGGYLDLRGTAITKLPEGLTTVGGNLNLYGTAITKLPESLTTVGGDLDLEETAITKLPESLTTVGGNLDLEGTAITKLPEGLTVEWGIYGTNPATGKKYQEEYNEMKKRKTSSFLRKLDVNK